jgi:uncharacterized membrane protein
MSTVEKSIEVNVPVSTAYNQWTQFEEFPNFMEGVEEVLQIDDTHLHWHAEIGGVDKEWTSEITEQIPDLRIAWHSTSGTPNSGIINFHEISDTACRVTVEMEYEPEGMVENIGDALAIFSTKVEGDLERFKKFIESRGTETGAWRGSVSHGQQH